MRAVTIDSDLATLFTFTPRKPPITPIQGVEYGNVKKERKNRRTQTRDGGGGQGPHLHEQDFGRTIRGTGGLSCS